MMRSCSTTSGLNFIAVFVPLALLFTDMDLLISASHPKSLGVALRINLLIIFVVF